MVALRVSVTCKDPLVVQLDSGLETFQASDGLYTIAESLPRMGVEVGTRPVVAEGRADCVVPDSSIQRTILLVISV